MVQTLSTIEIYEPIVRLQPEDQRDREKVNEAVRWYLSDH
jgi:hypothetical protein